MKADKEKHVCLKLKDAIQNISSTELSNKDCNFTSCFVSSNSPQTGEH